MIGNIDKLNLIAPLLAGRTITVVQTRASERVVGNGLFHSLEIDDIYPHSGPMAYFRVTDITWEWQTWPACIPVREHMEMYAEYGISAAKLECITLRQDNYTREDEIVISFLAEAFTRTGYGDTLHFARQCQ